MNRNDASAPRVARDPQERTATEGHATVTAQPCSFGVSRKAQYPCMHYTVVRNTEPETHFDISIVTVREGDWFGYVTVSGYGSTKTIKVERDQYTAGCVGDALAILIAQRCVAVEIITFERGITALVIPTSSGTLRTALLHSAWNVVRQGARRSRASLAETEITFLASLADSGRIPGVIIEDSISSGEVILAEPDKTLVAQALRTRAEYLRSHDLPPPGERAELLVGQAS